MVELVKEVDKKLVSVSIDHFHIFRTVLRRYYWFIVEICVKNLWVLIDRM